MSIYFADFGDAGPFFCVDVELVKQEITEASILATAVQRWFHSSIVKWVKATSPCVSF